MPIRTGEGPTDPLPRRELAHRRTCLIELVDRRDLPAAFVEEIETWKSRSGTEPSASFTSYALTEGS